MLTVARVDPPFIRRDGQGFTVLVEWAEAEGRRMDCVEKGC
jgi:hypothetical protein